jgi:hypothetical protein
LQPHFSALGAGENILTSKLIDREGCRRWSALFRAARQSADGLSSKPDERHVAALGDEPSDDVHAGLSRLAAGDDDTTPGRLTMRDKLFPHFVEAWPLIPSVSRACDVCDRTFATSKQGGSVISPGGQGKLEGIFLPLVFV